MGENLDEVVTNIRALIGSCKGPVSVKKLMYDYEAMIGSQIPYRNFQHPTLESFLHSIPSIRVTGSGRDAFVQVALDSSSSHIAKMIAKQRTPKKSMPPPRRGGYSQRGGYSNQGGYFNQGSNNRPPLPKSSSYSEPSRPKQQPPSWNQSSPKKENMANNNYPDHNRPSTNDSKKENFNNSNSAVPSASVNNTQSSKVNGNAKSDNYRNPNNNYTDSNVLSNNTASSQNYSKGKASNVDQKYKAPKVTENSVYGQPSKNESNADPPSLTVKVAANERRQVSYTADTGASTGKLTKTSSQRDYKSSYEVPPRFKKIENQSVELALNDITSDIEESLFINNGDDLSLREVNTNIITAYKPSQLVAAGRAREEAAQCLDDPFLHKSPQTNTSQAAQSLDVFYLQESQQKSTSQPTERDEIVAVPKPDEVNIHINIDLLMNYTKLKGWKAPDYQSLSRRTSGRKLFVATVKIQVEGTEAQQKYSGFPNESDSEIVAKGYAAMEALNRLRIHEEKVKLDKPITTDKKVMYSRISKIVEGLYNGMFSNKLQETYENDYGETLPDDWLDSITICDFLSVEHTNCNATIVLPRDSSTLNRISPPELNLPDQRTWDVFVTSAPSTSQVWLRLIGDEYSSKHEEMLMAMEQFYEKNKTRYLALNIEQGKYYVANAKGWHRVYATSVDEEARTVSVHLIDHGDSDIVHYNDLYTLPREFCTLSRQAFKCSLAGLEAFSDDLVCCEILYTSEYLIGRSLIAEVNSRDDITETYSVTLYDTSRSEHDDINVNETIQKIFIDDLESSLPKLPEEGRLIGVVVSHISKHGNIYIQTHSDRFSQLEELLGSLSVEEIKSRKLTSYRQVRQGKHYLAYYAKDNSWHRADVTTPPSVQQNRIAVNFIDYGNSETVTFDEIADVDTLPLIVRHLAPQALKIALNNLQVESMTVDQIYKLHTLLLGEEKVVLLRVVGVDCGIPIVDMYLKDDGGTDAVVYINYTIEMMKSAPTLNRTSPTRLGNVIPDQPVTPNQLTNGTCKAVPTLKDLKKPEFHNKDFEAVNIIVAANPGHFSFQLVKYRKKLNSLVTNMRHYYEIVKPPKVQDADIVMEGLYAFQNPSDTLWHRVVVTGKLSSSGIPVQFCDSGEVVVVDTDSLRSLHPDFCQVPFMSIKGKLWGVKPCHVDWNVDDTVRFRDLVENKTLASYIRGVEDSCANPLDMVVSLQLIDTLTEHDIVLGDVLCSEGRAVPIH